MSVSGGGFAFSSGDSAAKAISIDYKPESLYDSPVPGGGSQYFFQRFENDKKSYVLVLGYGGLATTVDCVRVVSGKRTLVAIKQISLDKRLAEQVEKNEMRGLKALSGRQHPNVVQFISMFRGDEGGGRQRLSFVFERCPVAAPFPLLASPNAQGCYVPTEDIDVQPTTQGCDLANNPFLLAPLTVREAVCIIRQVLFALDFFHSSTPPIVHRDIKPDNILVWAVSPCPTTGERMATIKITDYGTIRTISMGNDAEDLTLGTGTQHFMAPEVEVESGRGKASYSASVDVFSAGATFFYLVRA